MALIVSDFIGVIGLNVTLPSTMIELIPYLLNIFIAFLLVSGVFKLIIAIATSLTNWRRF